MQSTIWVHFNLVLSPWWLRSAPRSPHEWMPPPMCVCVCHPCASEQHQSHSTVRLHSLNNWWSQCGLHDWYLLPTHASHQPLFIHPIAPFCYALRHVENTRTTEHTNCTVRTPVATWCVNVTINISSFVTAAGTINPTGMLCSMIECRWRHRRFWMSQQQ